MGDGNVGVGGGGEHWQTKGHKQWGKERSEGPHVISPPFPHSLGVDTRVVVRSLSLSSAWIYILALLFTI